MMGGQDMKRVLAGDALVSVVAPMFNEVANAAPFTEEVLQALDALQLACPYELVLVDDGSWDGTTEALDALAVQHAGKLRVVHLTRNFGLAAAVSAGLDHARGSVVILMDADHQDDPAAFKPFLEQWGNGFDVVYAQRTVREENPLKRAVFWLFYRAFAWVANISIPLDAGNFALLDRRVVKQLQAMPERNRYLPGLRAWVGFKQTGVPVARRGRYDKKARMRFRDLWTLGMNAVFSFSYVPLFVFRIAGLLSLMLSAGVILFALYHRLFTGKAVIAWASQLVMTSFLGGINLLGIGMIGEYIARIYDEVKARPVYIVDRVVETSRE
ncbi:MAG TPA: glycosyltransferase family 2 protein [Candidatus Hydrogenedentes bacterium]|nr:glycosyltransferase family 2 protein [Candidatus Hydrogenedentota bacterium]